MFKKNRYKQPWKESNREHHKKGFRLSVRVLVSSAIIIVLILFLSSGALDIRALAVQAPSDVQTDVLQGAVDNLLRGRIFIFPKRSMLFVNTTSLERELKQQYPALQDVSVRRHFPWTLQITATEQETPALWESNGRRYLLNQQGTIISPALNPVTGIPVLINSAKLSDVVVGDQLVTPQVLGFITMTDPLLRQISSITPVSYDVAKADQYFIDAATAGGWHIYLSPHITPTDQVNKLKVFIDQKNLLNKNWQHGLSYLDLRFGNTRIYYK